MRTFLKKFVCFSISLILFWTTVIHPKQSLPLISKNYIFKLIDYSLGFFVAQSLADDFMNYVGEGKNLGKTHIEGYKTENLSSTLQQKGLGDAKQITPQSEPAEQQKGNYSQYYTNPEGMVTAPYDPATKTFVEQSYTQDDPVVQSYMGDVTYGNKCLQKGGDGKCLRWSLSDKILYENFPDCSKEVTPVYDEPMDLRECTASVSPPQVTDLCQVSSYLTTQTEWVSTPCSMTPSTYVNNQIYAVCKDYYRWYRVPGGSDDEHNTPIDFVALGSASELPPGAVFGFAGSNDDDYEWTWYYQYQGSFIERIVLYRDNNCGLNFEKWVNECTTEYLEVCDASWQNCVKIIENGQETGLLPETEYIVKYYAGQQSAPCSSVCSYDWFSGVFNCPEGGCYWGVCPSNVPVRSSVVGLSLVGKQRANPRDTCHVESDEILGDYIWDEYEYYTDRRVCRDFAGTLENYVICLNGDNIKIDNGTGFRVATNPATRINGSCTEVGVLTITYFYLYGSPSITNTGYIWNGKVKFSCGGGEEQSSECQALIDQGCVYYSHECLDSDCNQIKYKYNCGGTGQITGYEVQYVCSDGIRCMGSECHDTSYEANTDFIQATTAFTILNMYRADSDGIYIFPGEDRRCQSSPKNCCKNPGIGITIGDYIRAGLAAIKVYSLLSGGIAATWESFAIAFTRVLTGEYFFSGLAQLAGLNFLAADNVVNLTTGFTGSLLEVQASNAIGAAMECGAGVCYVYVGSGLVSNLATVMTVVTIALTVYSVLKFIYDFIFQCTQEDIITSYKVGLRLCHYVGQYCASKIFGFCLKKKKTYCCFNSILARLVQECVRPQIGRSWGDARDPDCGGLLPGELSSADLSICDFTEYMQHVQFKTQLTEQDIENIQNKVKDKVNSP